MYLDCKINSLGWSDDKRKLDNVDEIGKNSGCIKFGTKIPMSFYGVDFLFTVLHVYLDITKLWAGTGVFVF